MRFLLEARLEGGGVCGLWVGKGAGEGRQDTQDIEKGKGLKNEGPCICTGTPTLGLPPVISGPVALFMACVAVRCICPHDFARRSIVGVVPPMQPTVELTGSRGRAYGGVLGGNRHTELCVLVRVLCLCR